VLQVPPATPGSDLTEVQQLTVRMALTMTNRFTAPGLRHHPECSPRPTGGSYRSATSYLRPHEAQTVRLPTTPDTGVPSNGQWV